MMTDKDFEVAIDTIKTAKKKKRKVANTSVVAFQETAGARVTEAQRIIDFIGGAPGCSREEISEGTGVKLQSVTGNVTPLVRNGRIKEDGVKLSRTGRKVGQLWLPPPPE